MVNSILNLSHWKSSSLCTGKRVIARLNEISSLRKSSLERWFGKIVPDPQSGVRTQDTRQATHGEEVTWWKCLQSRERTLVTALWALWAGNTKEKPLERLFPLRQMTCKYRRNSQWNQHSGREVTFWNCVQSTECWTLENGQNKRENRNQTRGPVLRNTKNYSNKCWNMLKNTEKSDDRTDLREDKRVLKMVEETRG